MDTQPYADIPSVIDEVLFQQEGKRLSIATIENKPKSQDNDKNAPKDRFNYVYITVIVLGLVHFLPITYFSAANEYWMYKFRNASTNTSDPDQRTYLQTNFVALSGTYSSIPTIVVNFFSTFISHKMKAKTRLFSILGLHTFLFGSLCVFVKINTDDWQEVFFGITITTMMLVICTIQIEGVAEYNLITKLPPAYIKGFLLGESVAGIFSSILRLLSIVISSSAVGSALIYFSTGTALLALTLIFTIFLMKNQFFKYYTEGFQEEMKEPIRNISDIFQMIKCIWPILLIGSIMFLIPSPSIYNLVVSEHYGEEGNSWANTYFVTVCTFLVPAIMSVLGRLIFNRVEYEFSLSAIYLITITYQVVFGILLFLSNARPRTHLPVLLKHDWEYALSLALLSFIRGFVDNSIVIKMLKLAPENRTELAVVLNYFSMSVWILLSNPIGLAAVKCL
ncbi:hypothetical protein ABEB36_000990 [Hypothenemus hampei]|uniref:Uncharacterized protein n=1 Tax=Hypothenemus hampei TaxID=57062 RepID=A0ABD1FFR0_HYPHA